MVCPGIVTNVTKFGAFVDIGVHQDGLVHISQLADRYVKDPREVVNAGDRVKVRVLEVKIDKKQIALTMKARASARARHRRPPNAGAWPERRRPRIQSRSQSRPRPSAAERAEPAQAGDAVQQSVRGGAGQEKSAALTPGPPPRASAREVCMRLHFA